jgi:hypothetical protein
MIVKSDSLGSCSGPWSLSGRSSRPSASVISEISVEHVPVPLSLELGPDIQSAPSPNPGILFVSVSDKGGAFGIIKDLSPSNIDFGGDDKTKNFSVKPKLMNTMSSNPSELLRKKSNQCWSDYNSGKRKKQKQVKLSPYASDITFDQS